MSVTIHELMDTLPQVGEVMWMGVRPEKSAPMLSCDQVEVVAGFGITGDRFKASRTDREVTLVQVEHVSALASMLGGQPIDPGVLRRNIAVGSINLLALKGKQFRVGSVVMEYTGLAHPCSKMERALGPGGYNAMRGHGGITARVVLSGEIKLHDKVMVHHAPF
jgi:MOSC domain-containing protein YiiM